jgi:glyoxylase-like metal-dependent hydrolase (beta-lactamase superfamily II)
MKDVSLIHRIGAATITRVDETGFALAPDVLFPDWDAGSGRALEAHFSTASLDLTNRRVPLKTHLWVVEIDGLTVVVDTGIGNQKARPFSALFDRLDNPVLERFEAAGFRRDQVDYVLLTHLHVDHVPTPGHRIGHMAVEIRSWGETALFSGDVMHSPLQVYRPQWNSTFCLDPDNARASRQWLLERAAKTGAVVFPAHFPEASAGRVIEGPRGFEWRYVNDAKAREA